MFWRYKQYRHTVQILSDPYACMKQLGVIWESTNTHKCMKIYYTHRVTATCFGHSCGHLQRGVLERNRYVEIFNLSKKTCVLFLYIYTFVMHLWRRPRQWSKHVGSMAVYYLTLTCICWFWYRIKLLYNFRWHKYRCCI